MHIVILNFTAQKELASEYMESHKAWLRKGFADGCFLLAGSIEPARGGLIVAHESSTEELRSRVEEDPFVKMGVVHAEILEVDPSRADERLRFLLA